MPVYLQPSSRLKEALAKRAQRPYEIVEGSHQGSASWLMERLGRITSTRSYRVLSERPETRARLISEMIVEYQTLYLHNDYYFQSAAMHHGHVCEEAARELAEIIADKKFLQTSLMTYKPVPIMADSNDGLTADGKIVLEAKCPYTIDSFEKIKDKGVPDYHYKQSQMHLLVTGAERCLYLAFYTGDNAEDYKEGALYHYEWILPDKDMQKRLTTGCLEVKAYLENNGYLITDVERNSPLYKRNTAKLQHEIKRVQRINQRGK